MIASSGAGSSTRASNQPAGIVLQNNLVGGTTNQFGGETPNPQMYAGQPQMQVVARKQPVTHHQQHRSHSVNNQQVQLAVPAK